MNILFPIAGFFAGAGIQILEDTDAKKRKKYAIKALAVFLGVLGGYAMHAFLCELIDHLKRRKAFEQWKRRQENAPVLRS